MPTTMASVADSGTAFCQYSFVLSKPCFHLHHDKACSSIGAY